MPLLLSTAIDWSLIAFEMIPLIHLVWTIKFGVLSQDSFSLSRDLLRNIISCATL